MAKIDFLRLWTVYVDFLGNESIYRVCILHLALSYVQIYLLKTYAQSHIFNEIIHISNFFFFKYLCK